MATEKKLKPWAKDLLVAFAGTTLSIILTFGTSALIDHINRNKERKLTALMVLSSIESAARSMEENSKIMARKDTLAHWLLSIPVSELGSLPPEALMPSLMEVTTHYIVSTDKTIESIFSSNTDIWKNMGSFQFIDNVGKCYTSIRSVESDWNNQMERYTDEFEKIVLHPEDYPGNTVPEKVLSNPQVRTQLESITHWREWLNYVVHVWREDNRSNMELIGISEEEVMRFTDASQSQAGSKEAAASEAFLNGEFAIPRISPDSLYSLQKEIRLLDSLSARRKEIQVVNSLLKAKGK